MSGAPKNGGALDVAHYAKLVRIHVSEEESAALQGQLEKVLAYVGELKQVDVAGLDPMVWSVDLKSVLREDAVAPGVSNEAAMANAPEHRAGQFLVPRILE